MAVSLKSAVNELAQIPFEELIGGPMDAAIKAQATAAQTTLDFITSVGFNKPADDLVVDPATENDYGDVRQVTFNYQSKKGDGTSEDVSLTVPILTILPIPYIRIDKMEIKFSAKLTDAVKRVRNSGVDTKIDSGTSGRVGWGFWGVRSSLRMSRTSFRRDSSSNDSKREYRYDVTVNAVQDEMPSGLSRILGILEDSITAGDHEVEDTPPPGPPAP